MGLQKSQTRFSDYTTTGDLHIPEQHSYVQEVLPLIPKEGSFCVVSVRSQFSLFFPPF